MQRNSADLFGLALKLSLLLALVIAALGSLVGLLIFGLPGVYSALIAAAVSVSFGVLTILSIRIGSRLPLNGFYGLVLGGWLLKILLFAVLLGALQGAEFMSGPMFFFAIVTSVLGGLSIDSYLVLSSKLPAVEN
jgi:hypothetical protein